MAKHGLPIISRPSNSFSCRLFSTSRPRPLHTYTTFHPPRLHEKVAIVTGASSGLGRAIALQYASHGTSLVVCADLQPTPCSNADESLSGATHDIITSLYGDNKAIFVRTDVNDTDDVKGVVRMAVEQAGSVDMYVYAFASLSLSLPDLATYYLLPQ